MKPTHEIPFKQWRHEMATALGISVDCFNTRLYQLKSIEYPKVRRVNKRVVYVMRGNK